METLQSTELYQYIKTFLKDNEYRNLLNSNQKFFAEIKKESVTFQLLIRDAFNGPKFTIVSQLIEFVKYPQKQISLWVLNPPVNELLSMSKIVGSSLQSLSINTQDLLFDNTFDFTIFNNISVLTIGPFRGVTKIMNGFQNIRELTIEMYDLEEIYDMNMTGSLRKLELKWCHALKRFVTASDYPYNEIMSFMLNPEFNLKSIVFEDSRSLDLTKVFTHHIKELFLLIPNDYEDEIDYTIFSSIPILQILGNFGDVHSFPFFGHKLTLSSFDLSVWTDVKEFSELRILHLYNCDLLETFPVMPKLKKMELQKIFDLTFIPRFPSLSHLILKELDSLILIQKQPNLKQLEMMNCTAIDDISSLDGQLFQLVKLHSCPRLSDLSAFRNAYSLSVIKCPLVSELGLEQSSIDSRKRSLILSDLLQPLHSFPKSTWYNVKKLELSNVDVHDVIEFRNISYLHLTNCKCLFDTNNLQNIKEGLIIDKCDDLVSLSNLQHIPKVILSSLPNVKDISGLGHNEHLYITRVPMISRLARSYAADRLIGQEEQNPYHSLFSTIKALTIIAENEESANSGNWAFVFPGWNKISTTYVETHLW